MARYTLYLNYQYLQGTSLCTYKVQLFILTRGAVLNVFNYIFNTPPVKSATVDVFPALSKPTIRRVTFLEKRVWQKNLSYIFNSIKE